MNERIDVAPSAPRDFDSLRAIVGRELPSLPKRLSQVGKYALEHPDEIAFGTAASIAAAAHVQPSTLVRFAHQFGYEGFSDLQLVFRERLRDRPSPYAERLRTIRERRHGARPEIEILDGFLGAASRSIDKLAEGINPTRFRRSVEILARADTIYLIARRRSFPLTSYMAYGFSKLGVRTHLVNSPTAIDPEIAAMASARDAAIAISFTTYSAETVSLAKTIAQAGVPLVAITDSSFSPLTEVATEWLEVAEADHAGFRSLSASMALCMALTVAVASARE
ncbi:MAG TPA: MurR/RpiR family transcriptional regulator [Bauldia sp.]|nr:MurR/RpiR family transcriptional regulator [Bauldia sp.]